MQASRTTRKSVGLRAGVLLAALLLGAAARTSEAGPADVVSARAECQGAICNFIVTVRHADEGWSHFANAWEVVGPEGKVIATRVLYHPHVDEQPFTRHLQGVTVPHEIERVRIRARDSVHGFGGKEVEVALRR